MFGLIENFELYSRKKPFVLALILLICVITVIIPIALGGLHASGDLGVYLSFAEQAYDSVVSGHLFLSWANDNLGFGNVGLRFYPPVASYVSASFYIGTGSWYYTLWIYFYVWMVVGSWGVYLWVKEFGTPIQGLFAGLLYAIIPFPLAEIYQYSLYAEFAAGALIPYCLLYVTKVCSRRGWTDVCYLAVALTILILTHIPTTIIAAISILIYIPFLVDWRDLRAVVTRLLLSVVLTLMASFLYWIKVVTEIGWLAHNSDKYYTGFAGYQQWIFPNTMLHPDSPSYYMPVYRNLDAIIVLTMFMLTPFLLVLIARRWDLTAKISRTEWGLAASSLAGFFMLSYLSEPIWSLFTLLQKIQFPWRWLTVLSALATFLFVNSTSRLTLAFSRHKNIIVVCVALLVALMLVYDVRQSFLRSNTISLQEFQLLDEAKYYPEGTSFQAWWPIWAKSGAFEDRTPVSAGDREVELSLWKTEKREFSIEEGSPTNVRVATFYYPYWQAKVNGKTVDVGKDENGVITLPVPAERSEVTLQFIEPTLNIVARWVSIAVWLLLVVAVVIQLKLKFHSSSENARIG